MLKVAGLSGAELGAAYCYIILLVGKLKIYSEFQDMQK